jgi:hypothetical protein
MNWPGAGSIRPSGTSWKAAREERTLRANLAAFDRIRLLPHVLVDVSRCNPSVEIDSPRQKCFFSFSEGPQMPNADHNDRSNLPARASRLPARRTDQRPTPLRYGRVANWVRQPEVAGQLVAVVGLAAALARGLRRTLMSADHSAPPSGTRITPARSEVAHGGPIVKYSRTVFTETLTVRGRRD